MSRAGYTSGEPTIRAELWRVNFEDGTPRIFPRGRTQTIRWNSRSRLWLVRDIYPYGHTGDTIDGCHVFRSDYRSSTVEFIAIRADDWLRLAQKAGASETAPWMARPILSDRQQGMEQAAVLIEAAAPDAAAHIRAAIRAELSNDHR